MPDIRLTGKTHPMSHLQHIAIIGAGLAGLSALHRLTGHFAANPANPPPQITIIDKSRGLGGRLATRRLPNDAAFDHGAQYIRASDPGLRHLMDRAVRQGYAQRWDAPITNGPPVSADKDRPRYIGTPGMSAFGRFMLAESERLGKVAGIEVERHRQAQITKIAHGDKSWLLEDQSGYQLGPYDRMIMAIPAPQAATLLASIDGPMAATLTDLKQAAMTPMVPCWSVMVAFDQPLPLQSHALDLKDSDSPLVWVAQNQRHETAKGEVTGPDNWYGYVLHAKPDWSASHLEDDPDTVVPALLGALQDALGRTLPDTVHRAAHRWRYAFAPEALGRACHGSTAGQIILAGDWCLGNRAESAYLSGVAAADMAIDMMKATA